MLSFLKSEDNETTFIKLWENELCSREKPISSRTKTHIYNLLTQILPWLPNYLAKQSQIPTRGQWNNVDLSFNILNNQNIQS